MADVQVNDIAVIDNMTYLVVAVATWPTMGARHLQVETGAAMTVASRDGAQGHRWGWRGKRRVAREGQHLALSTPALPARRRWCVSCRVRYVHATRITASQHLLFHDSGYGCSTSSGAHRHGWAAAEDTLDALEGEVTAWLGDLDVRNQPGYWRNLDWTRALLTWQCAVQGHSYIVEEQSNRGDGRWLKQRASQRKRGSAWQPCRTVRRGYVTSAAGSTS